MTKKVRVWRHRQGNELVPMQLVEVGDVAHPDFQKIIEVASDQVAVEHHRQLADGGLEGGELSGVERSRTTPTTTSVPRLTRAGTISARTVWI